VGSAAAAAEEEAVPAIGPAPLVPISCSRVDRRVGAGSPSLTILLLPVMLVPVAVVSAVAEEEGSSATAATVPVIGAAPSATTRYGPPATHVGAVSQNLPIPSMPTNPVRNLRRDRGIGPAPAVRATSLPATIPAAAVPPSPRVLT